MIYDFQFYKPQSYKNEMNTPYDKKNLSQFLARDFR